MLAFGAGAVEVKDTGYDPRKLGRWCWMSLKGNNHAGTRLVTVYNPCKNSKYLNETGSVYEQHRHHLRTLGITTCPREQLLKDLAAEIAPWQAAGETVIILGDANDHPVTGDLATLLSTLTDPLSDLLHRKYPPYPTVNSHIRG